MNKLINCLKRGINMGSQKKQILCISLVFILSLGFMTGCTAKHDPSMDSASSKSISAAELLSTIGKSMANGGTVRLTPDAPCQVFEAPKNNESVLSKVTSWLQQAKPYMEKIPQSEPSGPSAGYHGPAILYITTSDKHKITIIPAFYEVSEMTEHGKMYTNRYIADVLNLSCDEQHCYIQSKGLYNWLKNDKWETEFEMEQYKE